MVRRRSILLLCAWTALLVAITVGAMRALEEDPSPAASVRLALDDEGDPTTPRIEPSTLLRHLEDASGGEFSGPEGCRFVLTDYGTDAPIQDVVAVYEGIGFVARGGPIVVNEEGDLDPDGQFIRWIAEREREGLAWRGVDIAVGGVAGRPGWATIVELYGCAEAQTTASPTS